MTATLGFIIFFVLFSLILVMVSMGLKYLEQERKRRVKSVLGQAAGYVSEAEASIIGGSGESSGAFEDTLRKLPLFHNISYHLRLANLQTSAITILVAMAALFSAGLWLGSRVNVPLIREFSMIAIAVALGVLPYVFVRVKSNQRMALFDQMFPEALDFMARSLRAGHAFSVSLEMMADETPDPVGTEFKKVFHEQNLGAPLDVALRNFAGRLPLLEVKLFASAVLMQRETGGNLSEILTKLAYIIRERFRLRGQVRAASAHGRITAVILSIMPMVTMLALQIVAPSYLPILVKDEHGRMMILGALIGQMVGYLWMRKIINIKV